MADLSRQASRLIEDFKHGSKLGERSTHRLLELVQQMAERIEQIEHEREMERRSE